MSSSLDGLPLPKYIPLHKPQHLRFLKHFLGLNPPSLAAHDSSRMTIAFFAVCGIDVLDGLDSLSLELKTDIIEWIYHLQVLPLETDLTSTRVGGFQGGSYSIVYRNDRLYEEGHLAMTYTALSTLITLGDDLSRVNKKAVLSGVKALQNPDGSFVGALDNESDMRFVYCAACICYILNDFTCIDLNKMVDFITRSIGYDGGIGQSPDLETHGGSTFCGVAALALSSRLSDLSHKQKEGLKRWCIFRQVEGFTGRPNKPYDTCYSFWVGGTLALLDSFSWVSATPNRNFIMSTQDSVRGGFAKWSDTRQDPMHTLFGLRGLSLMGEEGLAQIQPPLFLTERATKYLETLHSRKDNYNDKYSSSITDSSGVKYVVMFSVIYIAYYCSTHFIFDN